MTAKSHQAQQEYNAGYRHAINGGDRPERDRGAAYYGGWLAGCAEKIEQAKGKSWTNTQQR